MNRRTLLTGAGGAVSALALSACQDGAPQPISTVSDSSSPTASTATSATSTAPVESSPSTPSPSESPSTPEAEPTPATAAEIAARASVPVLCYHQLRDWTSSDGEYARNLLICPPATFRAQLDALSENGWTTIGPDDYHAHLTKGAALPDKPILLSFDDSQGTQKTEALPQLLARDMVATFFAMTVPLGKKDWLSADDLKEMDANGMTVAAHTWDHNRVDRYSGEDWKIQLEEPRETLEGIIGKPVTHFAYPYGAWNDAALPEVLKAGYTSAYQLRDRTPSAEMPLLTLERSLVNSNWSGAQLLEHLAGLI